MPQTMKKFLRRVIVTLCGMLSAMSAHGNPADAPPRPPTRQASPMQPASPVLRSTDFDFFFGRWQVENRRLQKPLHDSADEWETFAGTQLCAPLLGGLANYDELLDQHGVALGMSIHLYDLKAKQWSSTWVSSRDGTMQPPVTGTFTNGKGVFEGSDVLDGKPILVRYTWSRTDTPTPRWEQAFSADGGMTWETNWVMDYTRIAASSVD